MMKTMTSGSFASFDASKRNRNVKMNNIKAPKPREDIRSARRPRTSLRHDRVLPLGLHFHMVLFFAPSGPSFWRYTAFSTSGNSFLSGSMRKYAIAEKIAFATPNPMENRKLS